MQMSIMSSEVTLQMNEQAISGNMELPPSSTYPNFDAKDRDGKFGTMIRQRGKIIQRSGLVPFLNLFD